MQRPAGEWMAAAANTEFSEDEEDEKRGFEDWGDDEPAPTMCLFSDRVFDSVAECLSHAAESHGLDVMQVVRDLRLDTYGCISLVNYLRASVAAPGADAAAVVAAVRACEASAPQGWPWRDEVFLRPVLPDDPLLYSLAMGVDEADDDDDETMATESGTDAGASGGDAAAAECEHAQALLAQMRAMQAQMADVLRGVVGDDASGAGLGADATDAAGGSGGSSGRAAGPSSEPAGGTSASAGPLGSPVGPSGKRVDPGEDSSYFASYARLGIHEEMLADRVRTEGYRQAIEGNGELIRGKVVLDVGCGSGILSMFAARAGARLAIGVDASDIIGPARAVVEHNGLSASVQLHHSPLESFELPAPLTQVDVIVSEWMGYALLYESMLPTLITARERFLAPGGAILPSATTLLVAGSSHDRLAFFDDVFGFSYAPFVEPSRAEASVEVVPPETLFTPSVVFRTFEMLTVRNDDLDFTAPFALTAHGAGTLRSLVIHFDTEFDLTPQGGCASRFRTSPDETPTHWKQTVLYLRRPKQLAAGDTVVGELSFSRNRNYERGYDIVATASVNDGPADTQMFSMS